MALHPDFPHSPHAVLDPALRWFPADEALRTTSMTYDFVFVDQEGFEQNQPRKFQDLVKGFWKYQQA